MFAVTANVVNVVLCTWLVVILQRHACCFALSPCRRALDFASGAVELRIDGTHHWCRGFVFVTTGQERARIAIE